MSARPRPSRLAHLFHARNLVWTTEAARLLHVDRTLLEERIRAGSIQRYRFEERDGHRYNGISFADILRMHQVMWPNLHRAGLHHRAGDEVRVMTVAEIPERHVPRTTAEKAVGHSLSLHEAGVICDGLAAQHIHVAARFEPGDPRVHLDEVEPCSTEQEVTAMRAFDVTPQRLAWHPTAAKRAAAEATAREWHRQLGVS